MVYLILVEFFESKLKVDWRNLMNVKLIPKGLQISLNLTHINKRIYNK